MLPLRQAPTLKGSSSLSLFALSPKSNKVHLTSVSIDPNIEFDVVSCTISTESYSVVAIDQIDVELPDVLVCALRHLQLPDKPRILFNDHLASLYAVPGQVQDMVESLPHMHKRAERIVVWAGVDDETDALSPFIDRGNSQSTLETFDFAHRLNGSKDSVIQQLFKEYDSSNRVRRWARFQQLVYRDFFRGDPVLSSKYVGSLSNLVVQVSFATIPGSTLRGAADILFRAHPLPQYLKELALLDHEDPLPTKDDDASMTIERRIQFAYGIHLEASIRFGFPTQLIAAHLHYLTKGASGRLLASLELHFGLCIDLLNMRGGMVTSDAAKQLFLHFFQQLQDFGGEVSIETLKAQSQLIRLSPDFGSEKQNPCPVAAHRETFVHSLTNEKSFVVLLEILPENDLETPPQCRLREISLESPFEYSFVTNHMFLRPPLYEIESGEADGGPPLPPLATRHSTQILINHRSYPIPKLQEVFLRLHRHSRDSRYVYLWNVCQRPQAVGMYRPECLIRYEQARARLLGNELHHVHTVDMYDVLATAGVEQSKGQLVRLGLPDGFTWNEWLLYLAD